MTREDKELLLKDLCTRLPYKVYAQMPDEYGGYTSAIESIDVDGFVKDFEGEQIEIENIKPHLFPLSSMTEEQKKEFYDKYCWNDGGDNFEMDSCSHYYALEKFGLKDFFDIVIGRESSKYTKESGKRG
jgi:hypothetical protein